MLSTGSTPFLAKLQTPGGQHCLFQLQWKGVIHVSDPDQHLTPNMLNWVHVWAFVPRSSTQNPVGPKRLPCQMLYWAGHCLRRTQSYAQTPLSPKATIHSSGPGFTDAGSWLHPPRPAHSSPYHDWRATISIIRLDAGINQPLPLPTAHPDPTVTVVYGEPGLITEDTVSPLSEVQLSVPPPPLRASSPVLRSEPSTFGWTPRPISGGQKPSPNGSN